MKLTLHVWRQPSRKRRGRMVSYSLSGVDSEMSFLEMLDLLNENLLERGVEVLHPAKRPPQVEPWMLEPVAFDHDCREGICGTCGMMINGYPHGPRSRTTTCQLHMRSFSDGDEIYIEPFRSAAFPVLKDLIVDRGAFDRVIAAGGYVSVRTGPAPDGNAIPVPKPVADRAMDAAECIGCGACVAACPNASAMLFTSAKVSQLALLPQGQPERELRVRGMVAQMESEGFGSCTNHTECAAACPKGISFDWIVMMNRELMRSSVKRTAGI